MKVDEVTARKTQLLIHLTAARTYMRLFIQIISTKQPKTICKQTQSDTEQETHQRTRQQNLWEHYDASIAHCQIHKHNQYKNSFVDESTLTESNNYKLHVSFLETCFALNTLLKIYYNKSWQHNVCFSTTLTLQYNLFKIRFIGQAYSHTICCGIGKSHLLNVNTKYTFYMYTHMLTHNYSLYTHTFLLIDFQSVQYTQLYVQVVIYMVKIGQ